MDMTSNAKKDAQSVTEAGALVTKHIQGVVVHDVRNIVTQNGLATEVFRTDWEPEAPPVAQTLFVTLRPGTISGWHMHRRQLDRIFSVNGTIRLVLFDGRADSATCKQIEVLHLDRARPCLVTVPVGVWHAIQALGNEPASFINFFSQLYDHSDPDEWRLPLDTAEIPYQFPKS